VSLEGARDAPIAGDFINFRRTKSAISWNVAKQKLAHYVTSPATWFKVLNPDYTQKRGRREMFDGFRHRSDVAEHRVKI
jgi:hypothetical protein